LNLIRYYCNMQHNRLRTVRRSALYVKFFEFMKFY